MEEHTGIVTMHGNPLTLVGHVVNVGDLAPDFTVIDNDMKPKTLADFRGKILIIASVPSLDTAVCAMETRKFNSEAVKLGDDVRVLTISMDLPFAQKRYCAAEGIDNVVTLSDHRDASFGTAYGVLIKELRLLARVVFVVDKKGVIRYKQVVHDAGNEPDYKKVLAAVEEIKRS